MQCAIVVYDILENGNIYNTFEAICQLIDPLQRTQSLIKRAKYVVGLTLRQLSSILHKGYYVSNSTPSFSVSIPRTSSIGIDRMYNFILGNYFLYWRRINKFH